MVKLKGLGRGLEALFDQDQMMGEQEQLQTLALESLRPGKYQPRGEMDHAALTELAESIKAQGVIQPILARKLEKDGYEIIAGERRWRAAKLAGLSEVPVIVREATDKAALAMALIENIQRENLNSLEEARGIQRLINEFEMTHEVAAEAVGRSRSAITNLLRLLNLTQPVQMLLAQNKINMGHARALLALNGNKQIQAAKEAVDKGLSVRATEQLVKRVLIPPKSAAIVSRDILKLQTTLSQKLGAPVIIQANEKGAGKVIVQFNNLDMLDRLFDRIQ